MFRRWCITRTWIRNQYPSYVGVSMYPEWDQDFWTFADYIDAHWDLTNLSSSDVFDRIDNSKGYEPGNVRFTDKKGNARNRRSSHYLTYQGQTRSLSEWAEIMNIPFSCLLSRVYAGKAPWDCLDY